MNITRLLVNDSADSDEGVRLLKEAGIKFRRVSADGLSMSPVLLVDEAGGFAGLEQIRLYLDMLQKHQKGIYD